MNDLFNDIVPAQALGIEVSSWAGGRVELTAPLAPNLNDKGTAFAGSVASILTLAGWAVITLSLKERGIDAEVMVVTSEANYTAALRGDLHAEATLAAEEVDRLVNELNARGRSRVGIDSALPGFASLSASYAVILGAPA